MKVKDPTTSKDSKVAFISATSADAGSRQKRQMDHETERKELFSKHATQVRYFRLTLYFKYNNINVYFNDFPAFMYSPSATTHR